jgi:mannose-6-phosphate isomerase-like protein (cupin superfamily)
VHRVVAAVDGPPHPTAGVVDRFLVDAAATGGRVSLVQHLFAPHALAAPLHRHRDEDEFSFVLSGRIGAVLGGVEVEGGPGDLIVKPRGEWHTFWNAGDEPAAVLEVITPGGLEELFRELAAREPSPEELVAMAARYGGEVDLDGTAPLVERHGLAF